MVATPIGIEKLGKLKLKATVLLSGGIDSAACAHHFASQGLVVEGLFIDYGQLAIAKEAAAAAAIASALNIPLHRLTVGPLATSGTGELVGRNIFLISTALFFTRGHSAVLGIGVHSGTDYFDCSELFLSAAHELVSQHTDGRVALVAPFLAWTKRDVFDYFVSANLPVNLTYSCEAGADSPCGNCNSCRDRRALGC